MGQTTTLIISNEEREDITKIVKSLEYSGFSLKTVTKTIENETKEQRGGFLGMLLGRLDASLLGNMITGKVQRVIRAEKRSNESKTVSNSIL